MVTTVPFVATVCRVGQGVLGVTMGTGERVTTSAIEVVLDRHGETVTVVLTLLL